jgi:hypothetical protein
MKGLINKFLERRVTGQIKTQLNQARRTFSYPVRQLC